MAAKPSTQNSGYRYPDLDGAIIEELRQQGKIRAGCRERVMQCFRKSVVRLCGMNIGKHLRNASHRRDTSQAELGRRTGLSKQAVHTWFTEGIYSFSGLILSISELEIEWHELPCPSRLERTIHGYIEATTYVRQKELDEEQCPKLTREKWEYLIEQFSTLRWQCALANENWDEMERLAKDFAWGIERRTGQKPTIRGARALKAVFDEWKEAFQLCLDAIPIRWLENNDTNT